MNEEKLVPGPVNYNVRTKGPDAFDAVHFTSGDKLNSIIYILGVPHHILFIPVGVDSKGIQAPRLDGLSDIDKETTLDRWEDAQKVSGGGYLTPVTIPGREGQWVIVVFPFVD